MLGRSSAGFVLSFGMLALLAGSAGCRDRGSADQDSRPLPTPEPPASAAPRAEPTSAPKKPSTDESKPKPVVTTPPAAVPVPVPTVPEASTTGGSPATGSGGAPVAVPPVPSVPPIAAPSAACLSRCQGALQGCLAQPVDGGVPGFANLDLCKKAFEACQAACK